MTLEEIRAQYPQYNSLPDGELAYRLWNKDYKGKVPMGLFADKMKLSDDSFKQMTTFAQESGYTPTHYSAAEGYVPPLSRLRAFFQGATLNAGDELIGGARAIGEKLTGSDRPFMDIAQESTQQERDLLQQYQKEKPKEAIAAEMVGSMASPANLIPAPAAVARMGPIARAAVTAGAQGAIAGAAGAEGGLKERGQNAVKVAIPSALFGAGTQIGLQLVGKTGRRVANAFSRADETPSLDTLKTVKNVAYGAVDKAGVGFSKDDMADLYIKADDIAKSLDYVPETDSQTRAALKILESRAEKGATIGELDKVRQGLYKRYNATQGSEPAIKGMIDQIDEMIANAPATDDLMKAARLANSRYKKAELLDEAFTRAQRQTAATGSGGNILNKYRQAVTSILNNPKEARWFTEPEIASMESFVKGSPGENVLRRIGKLSPSGNGLMMALNIGAIAAEPTMAAVTVAGAGAKALSDRSAMRGAEGLIHQVSTGQAPYRAGYIPGASAPSAVGSEELMKKVK